MRERERERDESRQEISIKRLLMQILKCSYIGTTSHNTKNNIYPNCCANDSFWINLSRTMPDILPFFGSNIRSNSFRYALRIEWIDLPTLQYPIKVDPASERVKWDSWNRSRTPSNMCKALNVKCKYAVAHWLSP